MRPPNAERDRSEDGAVAIIVALILTGLVVVTAMVVDFATVRLDRQASKSAADSAVMAGLRSADGGTSDIFTVRGVCGALSFLRANAPALNSLPDDFCTPAAMTSNVVCDPTSPASASASETVYKQSVTTDGITYNVLIKSPYNVSEGSFPEESYSSLASDVSEMNGCDQLAVIITKTRPAIFGKIATDADYTSTIRSVGRVFLGDGDTAPAMLLLKRTGCPILSTGSNSVDSSTIRLFGAVSSDGKSQPGTIHADSSGASCSGGSNQNVFLGRAARGIVALAAPMVSDPTQPDPTQPGLITSVAALNGFGAGVGYDSADNVFGSGALDEGGIAAGAKNPPVGRSLVTRKLVDERYFTGVRAIRDAASAVFSSVSAATPNGHKVLTGCNPTSADVSALSLVATDKLFVDCTDNVGYRSPVPLVAQQIVFNGKVNPSAMLSLPSAERVYVHGSSGDAIILSSGGGLGVHTAGNIDGATGLCSNSTTGPTNKAVLVVKNGQIKQSNNGTLRACYTTMLMMGGHSNACIPTSEGTAPTQTPCAGTMGTGQLSQTGGDVDWTAPNSLDVTTDADNNPFPEAIAGWEDPSGPEDLAFWSESAGNNSSTTYNMNGQGVLHTVGVYMVPNADSFSIGGGAGQVLTNAQYIATSIALNGAGTKISMKVDPNSAVTLPELNPFTLVR
jgi:Flp pilus assembly protein TadG